LANEWNLVTIPNKEASTTVGNILDTNKVNKIYIFDIKTQSWIEDKDKIVNMGDAIWIHPSVKNVINIKTIPSKFKYEDKTTLLNKLLQLPFDRAYYLGNSIKKCSVEGALLMDDIKKVSDKDSVYQIFTYNNAVKNYDINVSYVESCKGFMVIKERTNKKK
jgi:hypothetical protein